ncbi:hypothetical protein [Paracidobacterium acidisoli]|uniref:hypothetical protein n=1 Tax=Paracidobacterium acidisoli TaxID=2303751 RepID=UPI0018F1745F|nr:hypothetical protein [Paracidobacterium acidisoli]MBT9330347.1 hypothetical protein [Paracidobacterium acidisoli]
MLRSVRCELLLLLCVVLISTTAFAQPSDTSPTAPVPPAILNAKTVFLSNAGADSGLFPSPFTGTPDRPYDEFYAALKLWNRYTLVADPAQADLVFEIQLTAPNGPSNGSKQNGASDPVPMFRLVIYDRATHYILWAMTESVDTALLQKSHDRNFDDALNNILLDLKDLSNNTPEAIPSKPGKYRFGTPPPPRG